MNRAFSSEVTRLPYGGNLRDHCMPCHSKSHYKPAKYQMQGFFHIFFALQSALTGSIIVHPENNFVKCQRARVFQIYCSFLKTLRKPCMLTLYMVILSRCGICVFRHGFLPGTDRHLCFLNTRLAEHGKTGRFSGHNMGIGPPERIRGRLLKDPGAGPDAANFG